MAREQTHPGDFLRSGPFLPRFLPRLIQGATQRAFSAFEWDSVQIQAKDFGFGHGMRQVGHQREECSKCQKRTADELRELPEPANRVILGMRQSRPSRAKPGGGQGRSVIIQEFGLNILRSPR